jgi:hypothetical protein
MPAISADTVALPRVPDLDPTAVDRPVVSVTTAPSGQQAAPAAQARRISAKQPDKCASLPRGSGHDRVQVLLGRRSHPATSLTSSPVISSGMSAKA